MNSRLSDPNNHVPDISPDDGWGDAEAIPEMPETQRATAILPRRRVSAEKSVASEPAEVGLRIDSNILRIEAEEDVPQRLEVQEISGDVVRLEQEEPSPQRVVSQFTFHERPVKPKESISARGENRAWGTTPHGHAKSTRWIVGMGAITILFIVVGLIALPNINAKNAQRQKNSQPAREAALPQKDAETVRLSNLLLPLQPEAMRMFAAYARATTVEEILPLLSKSAASDKELVKNWRPMGISGEWTPANTSNWSVFPQDDMVCARLDGYFPDQSIFSAYFQTEDNRLVMDWKATTAWSSTSFENLAQGSGNAREIRGNILKSDFYNLTWPESEFLCFTLESPDRQDTVWCYARRGSGAAEKLSGLFEKSVIIENSTEQNARKVTVKLERGPENAAPNQWLVTEMLHTEWLSAK